MTDTETIRQRVEKLLRQAADREGTPEGATFRDKAFELMARYSIEQSQLRGDTGADSHRVGEFTVHHRGSYSDLQSRLLTHLASVLHCRAMVFRSPGRSTVDRTVVFGRRHHLDRVEVLHTALSLHLVPGATAAVTTAPGDGGHATRRRRRSWMLGFIASVTERLRTVEDSHTGDFARDGRPGEVVLLDDAALADRAMRDRFPFLRRDRRRIGALDPDSYREGVAAGERTDLGQARVAGARALPGPGGAAGCPAG
ncbi:DUF2786 domain-containing protein [Corynebacterium bovis]|uniref:DUF2786 domain-containing protein n=2 Tax=Corynebacterium bovis TaxID=36808 RepID=UPI003139AAB8